MDEGGDGWKGRIRPSEVMANVASSYGRAITTAVVFLVLIPYILRTLGTQQFGLWSLIWAIVSLFALVDLGFGTSVVKFVADARGRGDANLGRRIVCTLFWVYVAQTVVLIGVVAASVTLSTRVFDIPESQQDMTEGALLVVGVGYAVGLPLTMFRGILVAHQKERIANGYAIVGALTYLAAVPLALEHWADLRALALVNAVANLLPGVAMAVHVRRALPSVSLHPRYFDRGVLKEVWGFAHHLVLITVASLVATRIDTFIIEAALDLTAVAIYALAMRISEHAQAFCMQVSRSLTPVVAELHSTRDEAALEVVWLRGTKMAVAIAAPLVVGCAVLARPLVVTWAGEELAASAVVLQLLLAAVLINVVYSNSHNLLAMRGEQRLLARALVASQVVNLVLSLVLVRVWGLVGVASATVLSLLPFQAGIIQGRLSRKHGISHLRFYRCTVWPSVVPVASMAGGMWLLQQVHALGSLVEVAVVELVGVLVFWTVFWRTGLSREERASVTGRISRRLDRAR